MKTKSFIAMSMIAALAAGCSSDDIIDDGGNNGTNPNGKAFVSLNIVLPSTNGTRSQNDNFDQGTANEYNVKKLKITYYKEATGGDVLDTKTYTSADLAWEKPTTTANGVTTKALLPVEEVAFSGDAWALVEINPISSGDVTGWAVNPTNEAKKISVKQLLGGNSMDGFFMTNTVNKDGSYLVQVTSHKTKVDAQNNAGNYNIFVERAVAKVELNVNNNPAWSDNTYTIPGGNVNAGAKITLTNWQLDITNVKLFPIRKFAGTATGGFDATDYSRFYGAADYRTYWAEDPNYDKVADTDAPFLTITDTTKIDNKIGSIEYCLENTFNTKFQRQDQTTRALLQAIYVPQDLASVAGYEPGTTWYTLGNATKAYTKDMVAEAIKTALGTDKAIALLEDNLAAGTSEITSNMFTVDGSEPSVTDIATVKNILGKITTYKNGKCYYAIRIKHLDYYCPWGDDTTPTYIANAPEIGGTKYVDYTTGTDVMEKAYLGRYGVVRNNWYKISINTISQPGTPTIPEKPETPDDEQKYYLQATINILDWAVRNQSVEL